jgi:tRNA(Ile)-lysidine synthetase-like protein
MLSADQTSRVLELLQPGKSGKSFSKGGLRIFRQFQHLLLEKGGKATSITTGYRYHLPIPGECHILEAGVTVRAAFTTADIDNNRVSTLFLDRAILHEGMEIRNWQPGDAYCPQGRSANIKIKELLQQAKVSRPLRAAWPVYLIEQRIIKAMSFLPEATVSLQEGNSACCCVYLEEIPSNYPSHSLITEE